MPNMGHKTPDRLKKRSEFLDVQNTQEKWVSASVIVQIKPGTPEKGDNHDVRVGFTVTKKMGGAVVRNRIKRRLREVIREIAPDITAPYDIVLIGRQPAATCPYQTLVKDVRWCLKRLGVFPS